MQRIVPMCCMLLLVVVLRATQLHGQAWYAEVSLATDRTAWRLDRYTPGKRWLSGGVRVAAGSEHLQAGLLWATDLTHPDFRFPGSSGEGGTRESFDSEWWAGWVRLNFSSLPARRFGFVFHAGLGRQQTRWTIWQEPEGRLLTDQMLDHGLMWLGGVGLSTPIYKWLHLELGYEYRQARRRPTDLPAVRAFIAGQHQLRLGLSLNFAGRKARARCPERYD